MTGPLTYAETLIRQGGLMRCCMATISNFVTAHTNEPIKDELIIDCEYEPANNKRIILKDTIWHWNKEGKKS